MIRAPSWQRSGGSKLYASRMNSAPPPLMKKDVPGPVLHAGACRPLGQARGVAVRGPLFVSYPVGIDAADLREGTRLQLRWTDGADRFSEDNLPVFGPPPS